MIRGVVVTTSEDRLFMWCMSLVWVSGQKTAFRYTHTRDLAPT